MRKTICLSVVLAVSLYTAVCVTSFRLRYPHLTETQLFLHLPDALLWRKLGAV